MPQEFLVEGLKAAIAKGESLKQAMMSFYNSGYETAEIEAAARALQTHQVQQPSPKIISQQPLNPNLPVPRTIQKISSYGQKPQVPKKLGIIILVGCLISLLGLLASLFLFRENIVNFLNNLF